MTVESRDVLIAKVDDMEIATSTGVVLTVEEYNRLRRIERGAPNASDYDYGHPDRCLNHERLENGGAFKWSCHKRSGHQGACSSHNDCGEVSNHVTCGLRPGHAGPHAWDLASLVSPALSEQGPGRETAETLSALKKLAAEVAGAFGIAEIDIRAALGNTNAAVLMQRLEEAQSVIAKAEPVHAPKAEQP